MLEELKVAVLRIAKQAVISGLVHERAGNFSVRVPGENLIVITPSGVPREKLAPDDLCVLDLQGRQIEGRLVPSSETPMHSLVYRMLTQVNGIVHTHSVYATAFALARREIGPVSIEMNRFGGKIPIVPFEIPGSPELGVAVVPYLRDMPVVLLENHGVLAVGKDLEEAYLNAVAAEDIARSCAIAEVLGGAKLLTDAQMASIREYRKTMRAG